MEALFKMNGVYWKSNDRFKNKKQSGRIQTLMIGII